MLGQTRKGFTLIELLVVIAIIAILAAILFPVFTSAREKAREVACMNKCKQISTAVQMYLKDNNDCFPGATLSTDDTAVMHAYWMTRLGRYLSRPSEVYRCPSAHWATPDANTPEDHCPNVPYPFFPYAHFGMNEYIRHAYIRCPSAVRLSGVPRPADTALIAESCYAALFNDWGWPAPSSTDNLPGGMLRIKYANSSANWSDVTKRHRNGAYIVYCDGHAGYLPFEKFYGPCAFPSTERPLINPLATLYTGT